MNEYQIYRITDELNRINKKMDRLEDLIEKHESEGNTERVEKNERLLDQELAAWKAYEFALNVMGYSIRMKNDKPYIVKR